LSIDIPTIEAIKMRQSAQEPVLAGSL